MECGALRLQPFLPFIQTSARGNANFESKDSQLHHGYLWTTDTNTKYFEKKQRYSR